MSHLFRFFARPQDDRTWIIADDELHHLKKVLRLGIGDRVEVFDGLGRVGCGVISVVSSSACQVMAEPTVLHDKPRLVFSVCCGALKSGSWEETLPFLIELGADEIHCFRQAQTQKDRIHERAQERWRRIVLASSKQCKRPWLPVVHAWSTLDDFLSFDAGREASARCVLSPESAQALVSNVPASGMVSVIAGGEMGLSDDELRQITGAGFRPMSLGPHVLRAVTAVVAASAIISGCILPPANPS